MAERHLKSLRLFAVEGHQVLRVVCAEAGEQPAQITAAVSLRYDFLRGCGQILDRAAGKIFEHELKTAELSKAFDGGRRKGSNYRAGNGG